MGWPTPMAGTPAQKGNNEAGNTDSSRKTVDLAGWPTTSGQNDRTGVAENGVPGSREDGSKIQVRLQDTAILADGPARLTVHGEVLTGSSAGMPSGGRLNPEHSFWLMAIPAEWASYAPPATRSTPKTRATSSPPSWSRKQTIIAILWMSIGF
jgi:hypothetical protein